MADFPEQNAFGTGRRRLLPLGLICLALGLATLAAVPGCGGCRRETPQEQRERQKKEAEQRAKKKREELERKKPPFEGANRRPPRLTTRPISSLPRLSTSRRPLKKD